LNAEDRYEDADGLNRAELFAKEQPTQQQTEDRRIGNPTASFAVSPRSIRQFTSKTNPVQMGYPRRQYRLPPEQSSVEIPILTLFALALLANDGLMALLGYTLTGGTLALVIFNLT
jgi:hypothetical protein